MLTCNCVSGSEINYYCLKVSCLIRFVNAAKMRDVCVRFHFFCHYFHRGSSILLILCMCSDCCAIHWSSVVPVILPVLNVNRKYLLLLMLPFLFRSSLQFATEIVAGSRFRGELKSFLIWPTGRSHITSEVTKLLFWIFQLFKLSI